MKDEWNAAKVFERDYHKPSSLSMRGRTTRSRISTKWVQNPTLELRLLFAHFECARGGSVERQKLAQQPLERSDGAVGGTQAAACLELIVVVEEASIDFANSLDTTKIPFAPSSYILQDHSLEWACQLLNYRSLGSDLLL